MPYRVPVGYNPGELPGQIVDEGQMGRIVDPISGASWLNPNSDPDEVGIDPITGEDYPAGTDVGFGLMAYDALVSGLYNSQFSVGPPDAGSPIEETYNEVPYWSYHQDDAGHIRASWVAEAGAPGGHAIEWTVTAGADGDEAYFEQIVPVSPWSYGTLAPTLRCQDSGTYVQFIRSQFLTADGSETGSEAEAGQFDGVAWGSTETVVVPIAVPSDARYLRVRVGCEVQEDGTTTTTDAYEVYAGQPRLVYATVSFSGGQVVAGDTQPIYCTSGNTLWTPDNAANRYIPPLPGWVAAISVRGHTLASAGSCAFVVRSEDSLQNIGPTATLGAAYTAAYATAEYSDTNAFIANDILRIQATATGSFRPATIDTLTHVTFALLNTSAASIVPASPPAAFQDDAFLDDGFQT